MPIVTPSKPGTKVVVSLDEKLADELLAYERWSKAKRKKIVETALKRLFADDKEFQSRSK